MALKRSYRLQNAEGQQSGAKGSGSLPSQVAQTADINTVADLYHVVKQKDKNFGPETASKVVNADGTPKVVYHQTGNDFTIFDVRKNGAGTRDNETPESADIQENPAISTIAGFLVRVAIQNFLKKPVISTVFKADE